MNTTTFPRAIDVTLPSGQTIQKIQYRDLSAFKNEACFCQFRQACQTYVQYPEYLERLEKLEMVQDILMEQEALRHKRLVYSELRSHLMDENGENARLAKKYPTNTFDSKDNYFEEESAKFTKRKLAETEHTMVDLTNSIELIGFVYEKTYKPQKFAQAEMGR